MPSTRTMKQPRMIHSGISRDGEIGRQSRRGGYRVARQGVSTTRTSPSRASAATASASSGCPPSTTARRASARRWRNEPSNGPCRRSGSKRRPRDGHPPASGQASHRGIRARQTVLPRSISAWAAAGEKAWPVRSDTRRTFTSTGRTGGRTRSRRRRPRCSGRLPAARSGRRATRARQRALPCDGARAPPVVAEPLPFTDHLACRGGGERVDRRPALEPALPARHDALHLRLLRHDLADEDRVRVAGPPPGRSRPCSPNHANSRSSTART